MSQDPKAILAMSDLQLVQLGVAAFKKRTPTQDLEALLRAYRELPASSQMGARAFYVYVMANLSRGSRSVDIALIAKVTDYIDGVIRLRQGDAKIRELLQEFMEAMANPPAQK